MMTDLYARLGRGAVALVMCAVLGSSAVAGERTAFRVCADPNNLPFSHRNLEGFENKLAELWAAELGLPVEYTWFPQRRGFIRNTLRAENSDTGEYKCDVVMGVPAGYELLISTKPYYRSTYALIYVKGRGLDDVHTGADFMALPAERRDKLKVGVFQATPGATWLARHGMTAQMVAYPAMSGDPDAYPGQMIQDGLAAGEFDAAVLWGPIAGYFGNRVEGVEMAVVPLESDAATRFHFAISAGVRFGEGEAKRELEALIDATAGQTEALLREFDFPLVNEAGSAF